MYELIVTKKYVEDFKFKFPYGLPIISTDIAECAGVKLIGAEDQECAIAFYLDIQNTVVGFANIARGSIDKVEIDPKIVVRLALLCPGIKSIILFHSHPSGNVEPSILDDEVTKKIYCACEISGAELLDHIIVGPKGMSYSYRKSGKMRQIALSACNILNMLTGDKE